VIQKRGTKFVSGRTTLQRRHKRACAACRAPVPALSVTPRRAQVDIVPREERGDEPLRPAPLPAAAAPFWPPQQPMAGAPDCALPRPAIADPAMVQYYLQQQQAWQSQPGGAAVGAAVGSSAGTLGSAGSGPGVAMVPPGAIAPPVGPDPKTENKPVGC